ncbi:MAG: NTP transferase domain-containing protein [Pseudomonadota bacterium]
MTATLKGLVLSGGRSRRMQRDKAVLEYAGKTQLDRAVALLAQRVAEVYVSVRADQVAEPVRARYPQIVDRILDQGPIAGILAALQSDPTAAWFVLACDLPQLDALSIATLIAARDPSRLAVAYRSVRDGLPEPLCAIYEPASGPLLQEFLDQGRNCPRKFLGQANVGLLDPPTHEALDNVNTPEELLAAQTQLSASGTEPRQIRVQYFALLREQARRGEEQVTTRARTPRELFTELTARHAFTLSPDMLKVAVNAEFTDWSRPLRAGDAVVFIPPVAGG